MANLGKKNGVYLARFRFQGKEYKRSLKTMNHGHAIAALRRVEDTLHWLAIGKLQVPEGVDAGDFIVSGGTLTTPAPRPQPCPIPTVDQAIGEYLENVGHLAVSNRATVRGHLRRLQKKLGYKAGAKIDQVTPRDLECFVQARLKERSSTTVAKEQGTLNQFFGWAVTAGHLATSPVTGLPRVKPRGDLPPFRTLQEIEMTVARGGLSQREVLSLWDCLFLSPGQIAELLSLVNERSRSDVSFILHAIPAYTGMRRGEVMRLRWSDIEFDQDYIVARSLKQSRQHVETTRRIDLHPELKRALLGWREQRRTGQYVACDSGSAGMLTSRGASSRFYQPLRGTAWCLLNRKDWFKIGFHTYRHSFASNLAAAGVDQRVIDEFMGHQTEAMRKRYRHLFPRNRRSAIECFSLASETGLSPIPPGTKPSAVNRTGDSADG
jgi:integrase